MNLIKLDFRVLRSLMSVGETAVSRKPRGGWAAPGRQSPCSCGGWSLILIVYAVPNRCRALSLISVTAARAPATPRPNGGMPL
jgi:hypothetical protein